MDLNVDFAGEIQLSGSKSIINRLLIISTYLTSPLKIINYSNCNDVLTMENNLKLMGLKFEKSGKNVTVFPREIKLQNSLYYIQDSGTAYRFLMARLASLDNYKTKLEVSYDLKKRPSKILLNALSHLDASIKSGKFPLEIHGRQLKGGTVKINAGISSQYASALLLISPYFTRNLILELGGDIVSFSYILMTLKIMKKFGIKYYWGQKSVSVEAGQKYQNIDAFEVEPDFSSASYFAALGALSNGGIKIFHSGKKSLQPDFRIFKILEDFGAEVTYADDGISVRKKELQGLDLDLQDSPDIVPTITILALFADSQTIIRKIQHLKYKESNRIISLLTQIKKLGADIHYRNDNLYINPLKSPPPSVRLRTFGDHRMVMSFTLLKMIFPQVDVENPELIKKSYPDFYDDLGKLRN